MARLTMRDLAKKGMSILGVDMLVCKEEDCNCGLQNVMWCAEAGALGPRPVFCCTPDGKTTLRDLVEAGMKHYGVTGLECLLPYYPCGCTREDLMPCWGTIDGAPEGLWCVAEEDV
ncbi:MAG: hypothetical protein DRJ03_07245 [Chloroflexi bacterium]|nr:MAG: hypothetical protein DRJ03_07245 [Chloroflexota bacterium]